MSDPINKPIELPCGAVLKNRLVKSAMTERISTRYLEPTEAHEHLYNLWSKSGAGLLISGNVMIDRKHVESAGNVCFDDDSMIPKLRKWAEAGQSNGNHFWVQISHAGRQTNRFTNLRPLAPSAVHLKKMGLFGKPIAMSEADIQQVIHGFIVAASIAKQSGFSGVQIHAAHGYLLSQFLSPLTNRRSDKWGGDLMNRSRLLRTIVREVRNTVGDQYPIAVKLNSSDFQRGGFSEDDSLEVVKMLEKEGIDLLEISGGTYEKVAFLMMNAEYGDIRASTARREAYFLEFAQKIKSVSKIPLLVTGGFRSYEFCNQTLLNEELDLIGMARPFITDYQAIPDFLMGQVPHLKNVIIRTGIKQIDDAAEGGFYAKQLIRMSQNKSPNLKMNPVWASIFLIGHEVKKSLTKGRR